MQILVLWIIFSVVATYVGDSRKIEFTYTFLLSILLSPIIGIIIALVSDK